jgi:hypothetical protein
VFEYKIIYAKVVKGLVEKAEKLAPLGWEMIGFTRDEFIPNPKLFVAILKRKKEEQ